MSIDHLLPSLNFGGTLGSKGSIWSPPKEWPLEQKDIELVIDSLAGSSRLLDAFTWFYLSYYICRGRNARCRATQSAVHRANCIVPRYGAFAGPLRMSTQQSNYEFEKVPRTKCRSQGSRRLRILVHYTMSARYDVSGPTISRGFAL